VRSGVEQRGRRHDLSRLAIAALNDFQINPRLLHFRAVGCGADRLDRRDLSLTDRTDWRDAGADRLSVKVNRAGTAQRHAATELGPGHSEDIAQDPQQRHVGRDVDLAAFAIDDDSDHV
jgi:hypothetical protein